ncbi:MAG: N-acetylmuramoyl-L-alanine amidase [Clostridium sp.]|nr:N-acetylmuramoyl-L-alanine amidase [Clostridium sp.]
MSHLMRFSIWTLLLLLTTLCTASKSMAGTPATKTRAFTLVIDAGHGGKDPGAIGKISKEKHINLAIALAFGKLVEQNCPDVKVVYTRKTDVFVPLDQRADIANKAKADLFISIHTNSLAGGKLARGAETYTLGMARAEANLDVAKRENSVILVENNYEERYQGFNPRSSESYIMFEFMQDKYMERSVNLAKLIQKEFRSTAGRPDKGVHQAGFLVLRATSMPSTLIEVGYISTPDEERFLNSAEGVRKMGRSIYNAFVNYKKSHEGKSGKTVRQTASSPEKSNTEEPTETPVPAPKQTRPTTDSQQAGLPTENENATAAATAVTESAAEPEPECTEGQILFKVQFYTHDRKLPAGSKQFKGLTNVDCYKEKNTYKYTYGSTPSYREILTARKKVVKLFPDAFVIAVRNGERMNLSEAIQQSKNNK